MVSIIFAILSSLGLSKSIANIQSKVESLIFIVFHSHQPEKSRFLLLNVSAHLNTNSYWSLVSTSLGCVGNLDNIIMIAISVFR